MSFTSFWSMLKRELKTYFVSPIAYIVTVIFLIVTGWFFFSTFFLAGRVDLRDFFSLLPIVLVFFIPAITMRLYSEEYTIGSIEIISTLPVTRLSILASKYLAALIFVVAMLALTLAYPISISGLGALDWGPVAGGYLGALLLAALYTSVGVFTSSLTKNQIVAFIGATAICFFFYIIDKIVFLLPTFLADLLEFLGADYHFGNFEKGIIDLRDVVYFLSLATVALFGTYIVTRERQ
ncbi:MAG: ABC transporter permease subunit [Spirochaetales bacterium]|nr:ABC transporter permease subunit [Spirochaetales bacterium]